MIVWNMIVAGESEKAVEDIEFALQIRRSRLVLSAYIRPDGTLILPPRRFVESAESIGIVNTLEDADHRVRALLPYYFDLSTERYYYNVSALLAVQYEREKSGSVDLDARENTLVFKEDGREQGRLRIGERSRLEFRHYFREEDLDTVSFTDVYHARISPERFRNRVVFVSLNTDLYPGHKETPLGLQNETVVAYNAFLTFLNRDFANDIGRAPSFALSWVLVVLFFSAVYRFPKAGNLVLAAVFGCAVWALDGILFVFGIGWDGFVPLFAVLAAGIAGEVSFHYRNARDANRIKDLLIRDRETGLPIFDYFVEKLRFMLYRSRRFGSGRVFAGALCFAKPPNSRNGGEENENHALKRRARAFSAKLRYEEILSWNADEESFYFCLRSSNPMTLEKRIRKDFAQTGADASAVRGEEGLSAAVVPLDRVEPGTLRNALRIIRDTLEEARFTGCPVRVYEGAGGPSLPSTLAATVPASEAGFSDSDFVTRRIEASRKNIRELEDKLKNSAREMSISRRLAEVGKIAAQVAHELKNPLGNLVNMKYWFRRHLAEDHPANECVEAVNREAERMLKLCREMLAFSKPVSGGREPVNLNRLVEDTLHLIEGTLQKNAIILEKRLDPKEIPVSVNAAQVRQVLLNVMMNAVEAMRRDGTLTVESVFSEHVAEIRIRDTGEGIPPENLDKIFDLFFSTKGEKGTGLGLSTCFDIVCKHRGRILVDSKPGEGTLFTIRFPVSRGDS
jgi:signal transduction histidine kinase